MNKFFFYLVIFFCLAQLSFNSVQEQKKLQEKVTVIASEVPVRVIHKGQVVKNLKKEDFELYENGVKQEITAFEVISRKISRQQEIYGSEKNTQEKKRLFILIFNIFNYNDVVGKAIDYFFQNFFKQGDRVIILIENQLLNIEKGENLKSMIFNLKDNLKKYKKISTLNTHRAYNTLNLEAERLLASLRGSARMGASIDQAILNFYDRYLDIWLEYKRQYFTMNLDLFQSIIDRVKQIEGEKWAICFQQREMFPKLKKQSTLESRIDDFINSQISSRAQINARSIRAKKWELERAFEITSSFSAEGLKNLFMEANITFHLILLKTFRILGSRDFELREVDQDYEACFKDISRSTGGYSTFSNKISEALEKASQKEDYFYLLVYNPEENSSEKKRNIEVRVKKEGAEVIHLKYFSGKVKVSLTITDFKISKRILKFSLINYMRIKAKEKLTGIADIKITIIDENSNKVYDEQKTLELIKNDTHISLNFDWLKPGDYFIIIQVVDKISQKTDVFSKAIIF